MGHSITGTFATRRAAEMAVERLVQEFGIERTDIFVVAEGDDNSAGPEIAGSDAESAEKSLEARSDGAHHGGIAVSVDVNDDGLVETVTAAFTEFSAQERTS